MSKTHPQKADIVIVGAGSAGCVLAERLTETGKYRVVLLEAGGRDSNYWIGVPFGMQMLVTNPRLNWMYASEPVEGLGGRTLFEPRGKVVGGTGAINASLYVRGNRLDYDGWRDAGCAGWGYDDVLPFFKKAEHQERGASDYHGADGPMWVSDGPGDPLSALFMQATRELGLPQTDDFNGRQQEGFGRYQTTTKANRRHSSARAYLDRARSRPNLQIITHAQVTRIILQGGRATGVEYRAGGTTHRLEVGGEVIVAGGTFNSPQILELSGIGDPAHLQALGLPVAHALPGVGANLQEHYGAKVIFRMADTAISMNRISRSLARKAAAFSQYVSTRKGPLAWTNTFAGGFVRSDAGQPAPDLQLSLNAWSAKGFSAEGMVAHDYPGITVNVYHLTPESRGSVHVRNTDPAAPPAIGLAALDTPYDRAALRSGVRLVRSILDAAAFAPLAPACIEPGEGELDDAALDGFLRERLVSMLHPVGTCRMGTDAGAVVDPRLRVHGIAGLRVIDASVMPTLPRGNTNAGTVMIAEKGAAMILEDLARR